MQKEEKPVGQKLVSLSEIFDGSISEQKPRFFDTDSLSELLCHRYNLSRHTPKEKLIDLVAKELEI